MDERDKALRFGKDGRYAVTSLLGEGGMGQTFLAFDERLRRQVAVKRISAAAFGAPRLDRRFVREAKLLARLRHPGLVSVFDAELEGTDAFIVQEYVEGSDLARILRERGPLPADAVRRLARDLADALAALHEEQVLHRDIKPGNVMIETTGRARLIDFGLSLPLDSTRLTAVGGFVGTMLYLAPEVARGGDATPASDIFQAGLLLHEALTGQHRFLGDGPPLAYLDQLIGNDGLPPARGAGLPTDLEAVVCSCCAFRRTDRPPDGAALVALVTTTLRGATETVDVPAVAVKPRDAGQFFSGPTDRRPWIAATLALLAVVLVPWMMSVLTVEHSPARDLFAETVEWARWPDGFTLALPIEAAHAPAWQCTWSGGAACGGFGREGGSWVAAPVGLTATGSVELIVTDAGRIVGRQRYVTPATALDGPVHIKAGLTWCRLAWQLHGRALVDVSSPPDSPPTRTRDSSITLCRDFLAHQPRATRELRYRVAHRGRVLGEGTCTLGPSTVFDAARTWTRTIDRPGRFLPPLVRGDGVAFVSEDGRLCYLAPRAGTAGMELELAWSLPSSGKLAAIAPDGLNGLCALRCGSPGALVRWKAERTVSTAWATSEARLLGAVDDGLAVSLLDGDVAVLYRGAGAGVNVEWLQPADGPRVPLRLEGQDVLGAWRFGPQLIAVLWERDHAIVCGLSLRNGAPLMVWSHVVTDITLTRANPQGSLPGLDFDGRFFVTIIANRAIVLRSAPNAPQGVEMTVRTLPETTELSTGAVLRLPTNEALIAVVAPRAPMHARLSLYSLDPAAATTEPPRTVLRSAPLFRNYYIVGEWGALLDEDKLTCSIGNQVLVFGAGGGWPVLFMEFSLDRRRYGPLRMGDYLLFPLASGSIQGFADSR